MDIVDNCFGEWPKEKDSSNYKTSKIKRCSINKMHIKKCNIEIFCLLREQSGGAHPDWQEHSKFSQTPWEEQPSTQTALSGILIRLMFTIRTHAQTNDVKDITAFSIYMTTVQLMINMTNQVSGRRGFLNVYFLFESRFPRPMQKEQRKYNKTKSEPLRTPSF